jgi:hypothetical protein
MVSAFLWSEGSSSVQKRYIKPDQVIVTESGILVFVEETVQPIKALGLSYDEEGLFVTFRDMELNGSFEKGPCGLHRVWHKDCGGCGVWLCPMNCTCFG